MIKNICICVIGTVLFLDCTVSSVWLSQGGYRPKNPEFNLSKERFVLRDDNGLIDAGAIYLVKEKNMWPERYKSDTLYWFYRFFQNGQVFNSYQFLEHLPGNSDINNLSTGLIGYFKIIDKQIILEYYAPVNAGDYICMYGEIDNDTITFYKKDSGVLFGLTKSKLKKPLVLVKAKAGWMQFWAQPDW